MSSTKQPYYSVGWYYIAGAQHNSSLARRAAWRDLRHAHNSLLLQQVASSIAISLVAAGVSSCIGEESSGGASCSTAGSRPLSSSRLWIDDRLHADIARLLRPLLSYQTLLILANSCEMVAAS